MIFIKTLLRIFKKSFDTSNYELERLLPKRINKKVIGLMKRKLGGKILKAFVR